MTLRELKNELKESGSSFVYCCQHHTAPMYMVSKIVDDSDFNALTFSLVQWNNFDDTQWKDNTICGGNVKVFSTMEKLMEELDKFDEKFDDCNVFAYYGPEVFEVSGTEDSTNCGWWEIRLQQLEEV